MMIQGNNIGLARAWGRGIHGAKWGTTKRKSRPAAKSTRTRSRAYVRETGRECPGALDGRLDALFSSARRPIQFGGPAGLLFCLRQKNSRAAFRCAGNVVTSRLPYRNQVEKSKPPASIEHQRASYVPPLRAD